MKYGYFHYEPIDFFGGKFIISVKKNKKSDVKVPDWKLNGTVQG